MLKTIEEQLVDLRAMSDDDIDTSDISDSSQLLWDKATTGKFFHNHKTSVAIDNDLAEWFTGKHENINDVLRQYMLQHQQTR
jgi:uncharacterized protein (DUF4415 family)